MEAMRDREAHVRNVVVVVYAIAMAWVEAAIVLYLRTILGEFRPYPPPSTPLPLRLVGPEVIREFATMVMLATVGWLGGRRFWDRFGRFLIAFGVWDIFYYIFLAILTGWPDGLLDWDILFLIPLPWWGPVYAPTMIALLMVLTGWVMTLEPVVDGVVRLSRGAILAAGVGCLLALYTFLEPALEVLFREGWKGLMHLVPKSYLHALYWPAWILMAVPLAQLLYGLRRQRTRGLYGT